MTSREELPESMVVVLNDFYQYCICHVEYKDRSPLSILRLIIMKLPKYKQDDFWWDFHMGYSSLWDKEFKDCIQSINKCWDVIDTKYTKLSKNNL